MMAGRGRNTSAAGGPARHIPVMLSEVLAALEPKAGETIVDGTFGAGGYTEAILEAADCKVIAIDRDPEAFRLSAALVERYPGRLVTVHAPLQRDAGHRRPRSARRRHGRCARSRRLLDADRRGRARLLVHARTVRSTCAWGGRGRPRATSSTRCPRESLLRSSAGSARSAARAPSRRPSWRTAWRCADPDAPAELADIVARVLGRKRDETKHPATRTFQALRLYLNDELGELANGPRRRRALAQGGRPAGRGHVSFAGGPHRQAVLRQPERSPATGLAPSAGVRDRGIRAKLPAS